MSNWAQRFTDWQNELKRTRDRAEKCSSEIIAEIKRQRDGDLKSKVACKVMKMISEMLNRENAFFDVYTGLFRDLIEFVVEDQWDFCIQCLNYSISFLVNKGQHDVANLLVPKIEIRPADSEKVISTYYSIYSNAFSYLVATEKYNGEISTFFKGLISTLREAYRFNQKIFTHYANELLQSNKNFRMCLKKHIHDAKYFVEECFALYRKITEVDNFEEFYVEVTSILVGLFKLETEAKTSVKICAPFIKSLMAAECVQVRKYYHHILGLYYYLIKLYDYMGSDKYNDNMQLVLDKFLTVLNSGSNTEVWFMDTVLTLSEMLYFFAYDAKGYVDEKNIVSIFDLLIKMMKLIPEVKNIKIFCNHCTSVRKHEICNIARTAMHFFEKAVENNIKEESVYKYALSILNYALVLYKDFKCEATYPTMVNACNSCLRSISAVEDNSQARYAIKMLEAIIDAKITPETTNSLRLAYLFKKFYQLLRSHRQCLEAYCFYIVYILESKGYEKESIKGELALCNKMYEPAGCDYSLSICDILDNKTLPLEVPKYDRKRLLMFQLEVACRVLPNENFKKTFAENIYKKHLETELDVALFVHHIGNIELPNLLERVEASIEKLKKNLKGSSTTEKANSCLALGFLHKRHFVFQYERVKKVFPEKAFTDTILSKMDISQFKMMDIATENGLVKIMSDGIEYFSKYFEKKQSCTMCFDHDDLIDCISYLARHLKLRGYVNHAFKGWKLIYNIACEKNDVLSIIRSLSFFCEHSYVLETLDKSINLKQMMETYSSEIFKAFNEIDTYTPRKQNYVLLCVLNIARFYVYEKELEMALTFSQAVKIKLSEIEARKGRFELVSASLYALSFLISAKGDDVVSPFTYVYFIMENIKKVESLTSEDSVNLPAFLFDTILEIAQFMINRFYCVIGLKPLLYMLLSYGTEYALTLRTAETICTLAHVDLHTEKDDTSVIKFDVVKSLLNDKDAKLDIKVSKVPVAPNKMSIAATLPLFDTSIELVRKAVPTGGSSPISEVSVSNSLKYLNQFLTTHSKSCPCELCKNPVFHMIYFRISILHARLHYIRKNLDIPEMFYKEAYVWWNMLDNEYLKMMFRDAGFWMLMYYVNTLRKVKNYDEGVQLCNVGLEHFNRYEKVLDVAHYHNMLEQKYAIEYIRKMTAKGATVMLEITPPVRKVEVTPAERYTPLNTINLPNNSKPISRSPRTKKTETCTKVKLTTDIKKLLASDSGLPIVAVSPIVSKPTCRKPKAGRSASMSTIKVYTTESRAKDLKSATKGANNTEDLVKSVRRKPFARSRIKTESALEDKQKEKNTLQEEGAKAIRPRRNRL